MKQRNNSIIKDYKRIGSCKKVSELYELSPSRVAQIVPSSVKMQYGKIKSINNDMREYIANNYEYKTSTELANELKISRSSVLKVWMNKGLSGKDSGRQYYCNFDYFSKINTPEKAYIAGFIMADGCLYSREGHQTLLQIQIASRDKGVLEFINRELDSNYPINSSSQLSKSGERLDYSSLSITSDQLGADLRKIGIEEGKGINSKFRKEYIDKALWMDFIFGYFDGDGSITVPQTNDQNSRVGVTFDGNSNICQEIQEMLLEQGIETTYREDYTYSGSLLRKSVLILTNISMKYIFLKRYSERQFTMERKRNRALDFIDNVEKNSTNRIENIKAVSDYQELLLL